MSGFRISFGSVSRGRRTDANENQIAETVSAHISRLKGLPATELSKLGDTTLERINLDRLSLPVSLYREVMPAGGLLLVVQAFLPTWRGPNHFSFSAVGRMFVEGIVLENGVVREAKASELWDYK